jgi:acyl transferase domain-containing protein/acyl carrier protein
MNGPARAMSEISGGYRDSRLRSEQERPLAPVYGARPNEPTRGAKSSRGPMNQQLSNVSTSPNGERHAVAIVGIGCRLPGGVEGPVEFQSFMRARGDGVSEIPKDRWNADLYYDPNPRAPGKAYVKHAAFLKQNVFEFDPEPFGISPREADRLDPQQRLLLEVTWEAFEDAGIAIERLRGSDTAVFIGGFTQDHQTLAMSSQNRELIDSHTSVGASMTVLSNRISYTFDLHGASLTVDTACSSSLVATHLGFEEISQGRCGVAVVGGVNVMLSPATTVAMCKGQFLAPDGRSKSFDARADGYGRGEGAGIVILKRLDHALRDGNRIYAVLKATGINQDGRTDGMPMPNGEAQRRLCDAVLRASGLRSEQVAYVEAHGTGTRAGDPIEVRALGSVYGGKRSTPLIVGSVKTNIGHLEAAAGVTGLIKAALSVKNREIFPLRDFGEPNPAIPFQELNVEVAVESRSWPSDDTAYAAVNSFGYGGTNAHAIVAEWVAPDASEKPTAPVARFGLEGRPLVVPVSAASGSALAARCAELAKRVTDDDVYDLGFTLACRRPELGDRVVVVADSADELKSELGLLATGESSRRSVLGRTTGSRRLLWVFTGMGPQWPTMGRDLFNREPAFRAAVEMADVHFQRVAGWSVLEEMLRGESSSRMKSNSVAQPANFLLQVGLVELLRTFGVPEHGMLGHSVGEVAAAWASGCLSLEEAARLAYHRSHLQQTLAGKGTMLAVSASEEELAEWISAGSDVSVAAYNGPKSVTLAGSESALRELAGRLQAQGIFNRMMPVEVAYHSPQMEPLRDDFFRLLGSLTPERPSLPLYSTTRGERVEQSAHDARYWWENARNPVLLQRALELAIADGYDAFLEVGPHPVLGASIREVLKHCQREGRCTFALKRREPERTTVLRAVGELYTAGVAVDWSLHYPQGRLVDLPRYPFQRQQHWTESRAGREVRLGRDGSRSLVVERDRGPTPRFTSGLSRPSLTYLLDHRIDGLPVFPGAGYIDAAFSASAELHPEVKNHVIEGLSFERVFVLRPEATPTLLVDVEPEDGTISLYGRHLEESWDRQARCRLGRSTECERTILDVERLKTDLAEQADVERLYARLAAFGLEYGAEFRRLERLNIRRNAASGGLVLARLSSAGLDLDTSSIHPALLDAAFQAMLALAPEGRGALVPTAIERLRWWTGSSAPVWVYGQVSPQPDETLMADLVLADEAGNVLLDVRGLECKRLEKSASDDDAKAANWLHHDTWEHVELPAASWTPQRWTLAGSAHSFLEKVSRGLTTQGHQTRRVSSVDSAETAGSTLVLALEPDPIGGSAVAACNDLRQLLHELGDTVCSLRIVTFEAHAIEDGDRPRPDQTALCGFGRVIMTERPELDCRLIDVSAGADQELLSVLTADVLDEEVAVRGKRLYARRVRRASVDPRGKVPSLVPAAEYDGAYTIRPSSPGELGSVGFQASERKDPGPDEVEVRLLTAALQEGDLAQALGRSGASRGNSGRSIAGRIARVGASRGRFRPGDLVHVWHSGPLASHLTLPHDRAVPVEQKRPPAEIAAYTDHLSAWYGLSDLARVMPGDCVLILNASNSLGLACLDLARLLKAHVIAIAKNAEGEEVLRSHGAGRVFLEGAPDLEDAVRKEATSGVQVVVSHGPDPVSPNVLRLLDVGGRCVMLDAPEGRSRRFTFEELPQGIAIVTANLTRFALESPNRYSALARHVMSAFAEGWLATPAVDIYSAADVGSAFIGMADESRSVPIVLDLSSDSVEVDTSSIAPPLFRADRTYLVTGGLAGFGLGSAEWLVERGAACVVLASRRGEPDSEATDVIERMRQRGARVECLKLDVAQPESVDQTLSFIRRELPPLAGVFHSAMVLDDGPIADLRTESLERVMLPKARGAWLLHEQTLNDEVEHFVVYSSVSALVGNPSQAAYAAANAYLDGLVSLRRAQGRAALSVSWGAIGDVGIVARDSATQTHLATLGIRPIDSRRALAMLENAIECGYAHVGIVDMDWDKWTKSFPRTSWRRLTELLAQGAEDHELDALRAELTGCDDEAKRACVAAKVRDAAGRVLGLAGNRLDGGLSFRDYGLDSLMAVELQIALERNVALSVPTIELLAGISVNDLVERVLTLLAAAHTETPTRASDRAEPGNELRTRLLSQICVQEPYFDLDDFRRDGEWLEASATPLAPNANEADAVSCAEAARHLAILGSCAVSLRSPVPGKVYYPVLAAEYPAGRQNANQASASAALEKVRLRARCIHFDVKASRARAETELYDMAGNLLSQLVVDYHVIPERQFQELFGRHAVPTRESEGSNPYRAWSELPPVKHKNGVFSVELGKVLPEWCLGHFVGFPSLPVSIMTRYALDLISSAVRTQSSRQRARITVTAGRADTQAFVFAHETAALRTWVVDGGDGHDQHWRCEVLGNERIAASFEFRVHVALPQQSGFQLRSPGAPALKAAGE